MFFKVRATHHGSSELRCLGAVFQLYPLLVVPLAMLFNLSVPIFNL